MPELELIDLDALTKPCARILVFGKEHNVLPANGRIMDVLQQIAEHEKNGTGNGLTFVESARALIGDSVPTLTPEDIHRLSIEQITALIALTTRTANKMEEAIAVFEGNAEKPVAAESSTGDTTGRKSSVQSAPLSSESPKKLDAQSPAFQRTRTR